MFTAMDGCSGIPDEIAGVSIRHCCDAHDETLFNTTDIGLFDEANVAFAHCLWDAGLWWLAIPALFAVSTVGFLMFRFGPKRKPTR